LGGGGIPSSNFAKLSCLWGWFNFLIIIKTYYYPHEPCLSLRVKELRELKEFNALGLEWFGLE
jgi:hypothetical protein